MRAAALCCLVALALRSAAAVDGDDTCKRGPGPPPSAEKPRPAKGHRTGDEDAGVSSDGGDSCDHSAVDFDEAFWQRVSATIEDLEQTPASSGGASARR